MVERWFREIIAKRNPPRRVQQRTRIEQAIRSYIDTHFDDPKPFVWTADLKDILPRISRAHETLDTLETDVTDCPLVQVQFDFATLILLDLFPNLVSH